MVASPDLSERGWNGGSLPYGAFMGRPSKVSDVFYALHIAERDMRCNGARMPDSDRRRLQDKICDLTAKAKAVQSAKVKVSLRKIRLDSGGYDSGGAYWGCGTPLYWAGSDCGTVDLFFRAGCRAMAKLHVLKLRPNARFYR